MIFFLGIMFYMCLKNIFEKKSTPQQNDYFFIELLRVLAKKCRFSKKQSFDYLISCSVGVSSRHKKILRRRYPEVISKTMSHLWASGLTYHAQNLDFWYSILASKCMKSADFMCLAGKIQGKKIVKIRSNLSKKRLLGILKISLWSW